MTAKPSLNPKSLETDGLYFKKPTSSLEFVRSGCTLLDCALGGGWPLSRISNIVGDSGSAKSLLAIEAATNFHQQYKEGTIYYLEAEAAFDPVYAESLGMPIDKIEFVELDDFTIESWFEHIEEVITKNKRSNAPVFYIVDSLDALSDRAELKRNIDAGSYGGNKPKKISELFRRIAKKGIEDTRIHLQIISQIRDNIGVAFGSPTSVSGGHALEFYSSQRLWLAKAQRIKQTKAKIERVTGLNIIAEVRKNRIGPPFRKVNFPVIFSYGIDDIGASLEFLKTINEEKTIEFANNLLSADYKALNYVSKKLESITDEELMTFKNHLDARVKEEWDRVESEFAPKRRKY